MDDQMHRLSYEDLADFLVMQQEDFTRRFVASGDDLPKREFLLGMAAGCGMADAILEGGAAPDDLDRLRRWQSGSSADARDLAGTFYAEMARRRGYFLP